MKIVLNILISIILTQQYQHHAQAAETIYQHDLPKDQTSRYKSAKCYTDKCKEVLDITYCGIKVTRYTSTFAVNFTVLQTLEKPIMAKAVFFYKYGLIYRQIINVPEFELCYLMSSFKKGVISIPLIGHVIESQGAGVLKFINHGCPYEPNNYTIAIQVDLSNFPSIIPSGMYKLNVTLRKPQQPFVLTFTQEYEVKSSIKTSF